MISGIRHQHLNPSREDACPGSEGYCFCYRTLIVTKQRYGIELEGAATRQPGGEEANSY